MVGYSAILRFLSPVALATVFFLCLLAAPKGFQPFSPGAGCALLYAAEDDIPEGESLDDLDDLGADTGSEGLPGFNDLDDLEEFDLSGEEEDLAGLDINLEEEEEEFSKSAKKKASKPEVADLEDIDDEMLDMDDIPDAEGDEDDMDDELMELADEDSDEMPAAMLEDQLDEEDLMDVGEERDRDDMQISVERYSDDDFNADSSPELIAYNEAPISDNDWMTILQGVEDSETYEIVEGDTLWDICQQLFGNAFYWPKVWKLNAENITNPHLIYPGQSLKFSLGSSASPPMLAVEEKQVEPEEEVEEPVEDVGTFEEPPEEEEFAEEEFEYEDEPEYVEDTGSQEAVVEYDLNAREERLSELRSQYKLVNYAVSEEPEPEGWISGSIMPSETFSTGDVVHIALENTALGRAGQKLAVYEVVEDLQGKNYLKDNYGSTVGYQVEVVGELMVLENIGPGLFSAQVVDTYGLITRKLPLTSIRPKIMEVPSKLSGPEIKGSILGCEYPNAKYIWEHAIVFLDLGKTQGTFPGMLLDIYRDVDPVSNLRSEVGRTRIGRLKVLQSGDTVSTAVVTSSSDPIEPGNEIQTTKQ